MFNIVWYSVLYWIIRERAINLRTDDIVKYLFDFMLWCVFVFCVGMVCLRGFSKVFLLFTLGQSSSNKSCWKRINIISLFCWFFCETKKNGNIWNWNGNWNYLHNSFVRIPGVTNSYIIALFLKLSITRLAICYFQKKEKSFDLNVIGRQDFFFFRPRVVGVP